jgi:hypothetical protein
MSFVNPHRMNNYVAALREARLDQTALGAEWIAAGKKALAGPRIITLPHRAAEYLPPSEPSALAYALDLRRGERFLLDIDLHSAEPLTRVSVATLSLPNGFRFES